MVSVGVAIWGLLVISSIISGFDNVLIKSITDFYPHIIVNGDYSFDEEQIEYTYSISFEKALLVEPDLKIINIFNTTSLKQFSKKFEENESSNMKHIIGNGLKKYVNGDKVRIFRLNNFIPNMDIIDIDNYFKTNINSFDENFLINKVENKNLGYTAIVLKNPEKAKSFKEKYLSNYSSLTWKESNQTLAQTIEIDSVISLLITIFIVLMSAFSVSNSLTFSFLKRKREIGLLKTTGFSEKDIKSIFLFETLLTTIIGYFFGLTFSIFTVIFLNIIKIPLPKGIFYIEYLPIDFDFTMMFISFFITIFIVSLIALLNLNKLMKFDYIEVLKDGE
jgi:lipoprotein-releasing system permease protein